MANQVKKGRHTPLLEFFQLESLLHSSEKDRKTGGSAAHEHYLQAALFIEFLRESKWGRDKFDEFLFTMGSISYDSIDEIRAVFKVVYGVSIEELEKQFQKYCAKR